MSCTRMMARLALAALVCGSSAADAMNYYKQDGVLKISGTADNSDREKLKAQLTSGVQTVILLSPTGGHWQLAVDLATQIESAKVSTVIQGPCEGFVCPAIFLAGKERMFSAAMRPEASFVSLGISTNYFPKEAGEDSARPWSDVTDFWRAHTKLRRTEVWPRHAPTLRNAIIHRAEHLMFFHPSARTSRGSGAECFGEDQSFLKCVPMSGGADALSTGVITTLDRYTPADSNDIYRDIPVPAPTKFAELTELPLKVAKLNEGCNGVYETFLTYDLPRAFVISSGGGCYYSKQLDPTPYKTAMDNCRKWADLGRGRGCRFYAADDKIVFTEFSSADPGAAASTRPGLLLGPANASIELGRKLDANRVIQDVTDKFDADSTIALLTTFRWEPASQAGGRQVVEARWFIGEAQVHRSRATNEFGPPPYKVWFRPNIAEIGTGPVRIDIYANDNFVGSKTLTIAEKQASDKVRAAIP
ncbi:MAG TPA: hypothetical protein VLC92_03910 [Rhodocyclaceae bacterium]|nr:hypothetical protein [Rhodocyclaceae bacterium]